MEKHMEATNIWDQMLNSWRLLFKRIGRATNDGIFFPVESFTLPSSLQ